MKAQGTFEVKVSREPPYEEADGVVFARAQIAKRFSGALDATSTVQMLSAGTPVQGSAGYVALEHVSGTLDAKRGSFALVHLGLMKRGQPSLTISVVPDSGTGELVGLSGQMAIEIREGQHFYSFEFELEG